MQQSVSTPWQEIDRRAWKIGIAFVDTRVKSIDRLLLAGYICEGGISHQFTLNAVAALFEGESLQLR